MLEPGMHLNAVGGDCPGKTELHADILRRPDARGGGVRAAVAHRGRDPADAADFPVTEFHRMLTGQAPGRRTAQEVTVFDSVGFALEDFSALRTLHARCNNTRTWARPSTWCRR
jgi:ornithine cyclodeaminase